MKRAKDYIAKAKRAVKKVNQQANTELNLLLKAVKQGDNVQVSGFID